MALFLKIHMKKIIRKKLNKLKPAKKKKLSAPRARPSGRVPAAALAENVSSYERPSSAELSAKREDNTKSWPPAEERTPTTGSSPVWGQAPASLQQVEVYPHTNDQLVVGGQAPSTSTMLVRGQAPKIVPIQIGDHLPSRHVLTLQRVEPPASVKQQAPSFAKVSRQSMWQYFIEEISVLSFLGLIFFIGVKTAEYVFDVDFAPSETAQKFKPAVRGGPARNKIISFPASRDKEFSARAPVTQAVLMRAREEGAFAASAKRLIFKNSFRELAFVAIAGLIILLPLRLTVEAMRLQAVRAEVVATAASGLASFMAGSQAAIDYDFFKAGSEFETAVRRFEEAEASLNKIPSVLRALASVLPSGQPLTSGENLLQAGAALSRAGQTISSNFLFLKDNADNIAAIPADKLLTMISATAASVKSDISEAESALAAVRPDDLPEEYRPALEQLRLLLPLIHSAVDQILTLNDITPDLLGLKGRRRYLVMFQNNHELRASGGFMGSFAIMDVNDGRVESLKIPAGGTYDMQGSLVPRLLAPKPLQLINPRWEFQDANWWSDWPTSAKKIAWFYRQAGGESVDGVVALDVEVIESLLKITGPIPMPAYNLTITADNFVAETQAEVELRYDKAANRPKQFIADLAPLLVGRLEVGLGTDGLKIAEVVSRALTEKHLLIYSEQAGIEKHLGDLDWAGAFDVLPPFTDSLGMVHTNVAGGKTDKVITDQVEHQVTSQEDDSLVDTLTITRTHQGVKGELFSGVRNVDYLRVYVPEGSQLLSAEGFQAPDSALFKQPAPDLEMDNDLKPMFEARRDPVSGVITYNELGRTVFAHWLMVDPGESATVKLSYRLPWRLNEAASALWLPWSSYFGWTDKTYTYRLRWEKQPGTQSAALRHSFKHSEPISFQASSEKVITDDYGWSWEGSLSSDFQLVINFANK